MPENENKEIPTEGIIGMWTVENAKAYLTTNNPAALPLVSPAEDKIVEILKEKGDKKILCFTEDKLYRFAFDNQILEESSSYYISQDTLYFDNPNILNFYIPYFYGKFDENDLSLFIAYLNKKEALELIKNDDELAGYAGLINTLVNNAQCEIHFRKNADSEYYQYLNLIPKQ
jgi:hypothetical protein